MNFQKIALAALMAASFAAQADTNVFHDDFNNKATLFSPATAEHNALLTTDDYMWLSTASAYAPGFITSTAWASFTIGAGQQLDGATLSFDYNQAISLFGGAQGTWSLTGTSPVAGGSVSGTTLFFLTVNPGSGPFSLHASIGLGTLVADTYTLSFSAGNLAGLKIDNVNVTGALTAAVPEPETYALMLAGLGAVGFVARRRKQA